MGGTLASGAGAGGPADDDRAATDRASARHWRDVALEREAALSALKRQPLVRVAVALHRRLAPLGSAMTPWRGRLRRGVDRAALVGAALPARPARTRRRMALDRQVADVGAPGIDRRVSVIVLGEAGALGDTAGGVVPESVHEVIVVDTLAVPHVGAVALDQAVAASTGDVLCLVATPIQPVTPGWLGHLTGALVGDVVAATPTLVHPARAWPRATEHDLLVRSAGFAVACDPSGAIAVEARRAGSPVDVGAAPADVAAAPLHCLVVDKVAYLAAGGIDAAAVDDLAALDLCARLRRAGGRVQHVPEAVVVDDRPVRSRRGLHGPIDSGGAAWLGFVERHGPWMLRSRRVSGEPVAPRWVITTAAPSAKVAARWGDWHLAEAMARSLRRHGQDVVVQAHDAADTAGARSRDVHLVLRGLAPVRRTAGQRHLLWVISHPESVEVSELDEADLVLVASPRFAADLAARTTTPVEVLLQATDPERFRPRPVDPRHQHPVTVVAKTRAVRRRIVDDALAAGIRPAIYGSGWGAMVDPSLVVADHIDNEHLPIVYSSAGVVLNDHWDTMRTWGFVSNRIFDVLACGTPVISDDVAGLPDLFGDAVPTYRTSTELGDLVRTALEDPAGARRRAEQGRAIVLDRHTFDRRAEELLELLARHGIDPADG